MKNFISFIVYIFPDMLIVSGFASLFYGLHQYTPWIAYSVLGAGLIGVGLLGSR